MVWGLEDMTYLELYNLLYKKGFREIEPNYYTICYNFYNYFVYINPLKDLMLLYVIDVNGKPDIIIKESVIEFFFQDIDRLFFDHESYWSVDCLTRKYLKKLYEHEKVDDYHINENEI